jgi:hypothetical protein
MFDLERAKKEGCLTNDGCKVRIICDDKLDAYPLVSLVRGAYADTEHLLTHKKDGSSPIRASLSLKNLPRKVYGFVYKFDGVYVASAMYFSSEKRELGMAGKKVFATFEDDYDD